ncbi:Saposin B-type domain-containing protein [Caenorhabditis elegans]|uniref:Saposin B-type domain-containing protein n=1 Tax=Caenorhabditis elegans TaxID=6239 RepID=U4PCI4_CAEEL|nr:Saposin B-type domain-containing protein [Caenorhabditis elegans]CDH93448.1 Saposin B-type domain-containing protein [Caenorhabditis elegans]|eukprot:NP_001294774.1 Uncharacterized protein CELE_K04A8.19 [Caenorhabditis elegans]
MFKVILPVIFLVTLIQCSPVFRKNSVSSMICTNCQSTVKFFMQPFKNIELLSSIGFSNFVNQAICESIHLCSPNTTILDLR